MIWSVSSPENLSTRATTLLQSEDSEIFISPISAAEIACASERGRISIDRHWKKWFRHYLDLNGWQIENIDLPLIEEAYSLPESFHADPADRIIVATARIRNYSVLTADRKILDYPHVESIW